ncbi:hypothetical protein Poli38472_006461 [Pythium oligandrum]|uniref:Uncharacterized protein n=1 Tax=Pythium oligandrum TaxID=41045 RepID=A0A8K1C4M9_PYTOL|nr:hypothetical protein Poli38472_006461 [Pythium oligandrum]|eukprot:TMW56451.1 hypothetical protein Poli38472_006461 [Pythium oligandrum]
MDAAHADHGIHAHRPPVAVVAPRLRYKHNLAAKLDAVTKNSLWGRRKVVLNDDKNALKTALRNGSPRHASVANPIMSAPESSRSSGGYSSNKELSASELEIKVMTAFRQIVRIWRERRRKAEAKAVSMMNGNSNGAATNKFRRDLSAHSSNVVGIVSRRLIREVPALKFFDDETEINPVTVAPTTTNRASVLVPNKRTSTTVPAPPPQRPLSPSALVPVMGTTPQAERARPRGVCYTLDAFGCRKIKMRSSTSTPSRRENKSSDHNGKSEELTLEKAMRRSLHRK